MNYHIQMPSKFFNSVSLFIPSFLALYFVASIFIVHLVRPDLGLYYQGLSNYAVGDKGIIMEMGFLSLITAEILTAINIFKTRKNARISALLLFAAGIGMLIVVMFPATSADPISISKTIHYLGAFTQGICFTISVLLICKNLEKSNFKSYSKTTGILMLTITLIISTMYLCKIILGIDQIPTLGLIQKIGLLVTGLWLVVASHKMINSKYV